VKHNNGKIVLSASDLMRFQGCPHAAALDLRYLNGEHLVPAEDTASARLIQSKGDAHELAFLNSLIESGKSVHTIDTRFTDGRDPRPRSREVFSFHRPRPRCLSGQSSPLYRCRGRLAGLLLV
jgi:hypothetical protein